MPAGARRAVRRGLIIDPFHGGALLSRDRLARKAEGHGADEGEARLLPRASKKQILFRMLGNLKRVYVKMQSFPQAREVADLLIAVDPSAVGELRDRGLLAYQLKDFSRALRDLEAYLERLPAGAQGDEERKDRERIWEHVKQLRTKVASLN
jgi:regulator of sirC expression with transglutaminase-like and TPR domain